MTPPGIVNVKDYGAVGDGSHDDYYAIQSAIAAINTQGGGIMFFPPGIYKINQYKIVGTTKTGLLPNGITELRIAIIFRYILVRFSVVHS